MKQKIEKMATTHRLILTKKQYFFHFFFVVFMPLSILLISEIVCRLIGLDENMKLNTMNTITIISLILAFIYFVRQFNGLKLIAIEIELDDQSFRNAYRQLAKQLDWIIEEEGEGYVFLTTEFKWSNWGTLMPVFKTKDKVMFTSICDLHNRPSTLSFGSNSKNKKALTKIFENLKTDQVK